MRRHLPLPHCAGLRDLAAARNHRYPIQYAGTARPADCPDNHYTRPNIDCGADFDLAAHAGSIRHRNRPAHRFPDGYGNPYRIAYRHHNEHGDRHNNGDRYCHANPYRYGGNAFSDADGYAGTERDAHRDRDRDHPHGDGIETHPN